MENNDSQLIYEQYRTITEQARQNPVIDEDGNKRWYNDRGELHREDGPAIEWVDGSKEWYINDKFHREDGPAAEYVNGGNRWYINDKLYRTIPEWAAALFKYKGVTRETLKDMGRDYNTFLNAVIGVMQGKYGDSDSQLIDEQYRTITEQARQNPVIDEDGNKYWHNDRNKLHREDGPAVEYAIGIKEWWINGNLHREDGPAIEGADGSKEWFINDKRHREDGPAVEYASGDKWWYINDELHREDGPAYEGADGSKQWWINGKHYKSIREWAAALFKYKGLTRETLKNTGRDYNTLLNTLIKMMQSKYGK